MVCDNLQNTSIAANGTLAHYLQPQTDRKTIKAKVKVLKKTKKTGDPSL